jgi:hypothetical protein
MKTNLDTVPLFTRRRFLALSLLCSTGALTPGCGGGGGGGSTPSLDEFKRTIPTGKTSEQVNQYSESINASSDINHLMLPLYDEFRSFTGISRSLMDHPHRASGKSLAYHLSTSVMASRIIGYNYSKLTQTVLHLDDSANMAGIVSSTNNLTGTSSLSNPQWHAEMMRKIHSVLVLNEYSQKFAKIAGINEMASMVAQQSDSVAKSYFYTLFAIAFNRWSDRTQWLAKRDARNDLKLNIGSQMAVSDIDSELARIESIVGQLVLSPGFNKAKLSSRTENSEQSDNESTINAFKTMVSTFTESFIENFSQFRTYEVEINSFIRNEASELSLSMKAFLSGVKDFANESVSSINITDTTTYILNVSGFFKKFYADLEKAVFEQAVQTVLSAIFASEFGATGEQFIECISGLVGMGMSLDAAATSLVAAGACIAFSAGACAIPIAGSAVLTAVATWDVMQTDEACLKLIRMLREDKEAMKKATDDLKANAQQPVRNIPAFTNSSGAECDQLAAAGVSLKTISVYSSTRSRQESTAQVPLIGVPVEVYRQIISGRGVAGQYPRTYDNVRRSLVGLLNEYATRNADTLSPTLSTNGLTLYTSDFAILVRRDPGTTQSRIPSLTNARIMCTSPGLAPQRSDSANIQTMPSLPKLDLLTGVGFGVNVDVK